MPVPIYETDQIIIARKIQEEINYFSSLVEASNKDRYFEGKRDAFIYAKLILERAGISFDKVEKG